MHRLSWFLVIPLLFVLVPVTKADDASKRAKIEEIFKVSKLDQLLKQSIAMSMNQVKSGFYQQLFGVKVPPDQQQTMVEFQDKVEKLMTDALSWESLEPAYAKIFADAYTEEEIDGILAFYKSPSGQALLAKTPVLMAQGSLLAQQRVTAIQPQLQELMKEYRTRLKPAAGSNSQTKP